jgi:predicted dehydrogenase
VSGKGSEPIRLGIVGAGFIAQVTHLHAYARLEGCQLAALADNRHALRDAVAQSFNIPRTLDRGEDLYADRDLDAFIVVLPRRTMGPALASALATGKPVFAEKPMAHTLEQGRHLVEIAEKNRSPFAVGFMKRHDPGVQQFRALLQEHMASATLGAIRHVTMTDFCATYGVAIPPHRRGDAPRPYRLEEWKTLPEGLPEAYRADYEYTLNVASHDINLLRYLFGDGFRAVSLRARPGMQSATLTNDAFDIRLDFGRVDLGRWEQTLTVVFERGTLSLMLPSPMARGSVAEVECVRGGTSERIRIAPERHIWCFEAQARQFLDVVRGEAQPLASGRDALGDLAIIEALWQNVTWSA